jgi:hypothetical protein
MILDVLQVDFPWPIAGASGPKAIHHSVDLSRSLSDLFWHCRIISICATHSQDAAANDQGRKNEIFLGNQTGRRALKRKTAPVSRRRLRCDRFLPKLRPPSYRVSFAVVVRENYKDFAKESS